MWSAQFMVEVEFQSCSAIRSLLDFHHGGFRPILSKPQWPAEGVGQCRWLRRMVVGPRLSGFKLISDRTEWLDEFRMIHLHIYIYSFFNILLSRWQRLQYMFIIVYMSLYASNLCSLEFRMVARNPWDVPSDAHHIKSFCQLCAERWLEDSSSPLWHHRGDEWLEAGCLGFVSCVYAYIWCLDRFGQKSEISCWKVYCVFLHAYWHVSSNYHVTIIAFWIVRYLDTATSILATTSHDPFRLIVRYPSCIPCCQSGFHRSSSKSPSFCR